MPLPLLIEIYADIVCPWCYVGKHRLDRALAERPGLAVDIRWLPFQLNPDMPPGGMDRALYLSAKFGGPAKARDVAVTVEQTAARDGLSLHLERIRRTPNTLDAHRLVRLAASQGLAGPVLDGLFKAYFVEGRDIGQVGVLADVAAAAGLDREAAYDHLAGDMDRQAIRDADAQARRLGLQSVPTFIFNRRFALTGAQDWPALVPMLDAAAGITVAAQ